MTAKARCLGLAMAIVVLHCAALGMAGERALWLRYPSISPDGQVIVFSFRGDLWRVSSSGGVATPLTVHDAYEFMPVWSPDGRSIAFASDRHGSFDVFLMPAEGGQARRLTFHSADDLPSSFTPDGLAVLFSSARLDAAACVQFPSGEQPELYRVSLDGGMPVQVLTTPALYAVYDRAGQRLAYSDHKGYEDIWRKHDTSSFARDLWLLDVTSGRHTRLTDFGYDDRQPVWSPDESSLYYLSERSGSFNVWRLPLADPSHPVQVTALSGHPVRFLSASTAGDLCYTWDGEIFVQPAGTTEARRLEVQVGADRHASAEEWLDVSDQITELDVSRDGTEIAFVAHGEIFVASSEHGVTRRITSTPEQERSVSFSPDGRSLLYAGERNGSWNLYKSDLVDATEPNFFNATAVEEKVVLATDVETFQPHFSPDGAKVAFLEERTALKVLDLASGVTTTVLPGDVNYSYSDGDQWYQWSPDGRWFLVEFLSPTRWSVEVGLLPASGGQLVNLTRDGYEDMRPRFSKDGDFMYWVSDRNGMRRHAGYGSQDDVYLAFFTQKAFDRFRLTEAEYDQVKAAEEKAKKEKEKGEEAKDKDKDKEKKDKDEEKPKLADPVAMELERLEDRTVRLTLHSSSLADACLTPDGERLLYLAKFEKGYDLWSYLHRKQEVKLLCKLNAERAGGLAVDRDGKKAFLLADGKLTTVDIEKGEAKPVKLSAEMRLDGDAERAYLFEHAWRQALQKFYAVDMHGVDWSALKAEYARFLPYVESRWDFAELLSELLGELNASHTGAGYRPKRERAEVTASLAFFPDPGYSGEGVKIAEIVDKSPLLRAGSKVKPGTVIAAIDGQRIAAGSNWYKLLVRKAGSPVRLDLLDPASGERWQESVKPITPAEERELLYLRFVRRNREAVERLSGGRIGYAHIRGMNDLYYRQVFEEVFGRAVDKEAIVLDTRFNGGGNLVEALTIFLDGKVYARNVPRGREIGVDPMMRWTKPSVVVVNEGNYSDAHCFPEAYSELALGETVGMPVPGTCTSVWWETLQDGSLYFGIPEVGVVDNHGRVLENKHFTPTHVVDNDPELEAAGRDQQLEKAVEALLAKLGS